MNRSIEEEKANLDKLRDRMENIRKTAALINQQKRKRIMSHDLAIRTGDILMFADDFDEDDIEVMPPVSVKMKPSTRMSELSGSTENFEVESQATVTSVDLIIENSKKFKNFCTRFLQKWFRAVHEQSRQHTYIIKLLSEEKKYLREALTNSSSPEDESEENFNMRLKSSLGNYQSIFAKATSEVAKQMKFDL